MDRSSTKDVVQQREAEKDVARRRPYQKPTVKVLDESEVLATFQITSAFGSWWI